MLSAFAEYSRCPDVLLNVPKQDGFHSAEGFFRWNSMVLFGRTRGLPTSERPCGPFRDEVRHAEDGSLNLPFQPTAVADGLRRERYMDHQLPAKATTWDVKSVARKTYYAVRPLLPVAVRKHAQRWALRDWQTLTFPSWPVDVTVDELMNAIFGRLLDVHGTDELPFIWFWPHGHDACSIMTHDVETAAGRDFSRTLIRMEAEHRIRSAFEIVPEERYEVPQTYLEQIRSAGCEVCLHGLNHDGRLFLTEAIFRERAKKINAYARQYGARGFRSPVMYRRVDWYDAFEFSYDMSLPNVAHLDPQRGGCCTVMPYFIGELVELPLTTTQDYQLYHILKRYDLDLWKQQCDILLKHHGLLSFIIHPDYTMSQRAQDLYRRLLEHLARLREDRNVWIALPGDVDRWWRQRSQLCLERDGQSWRIVGAGREQARLAFAFKASGRVGYRIASAPESRIVGSAVDAPVIRVNTPSH
jgi:peptidoglycan/xylan/chitin deacetylase (PgdA/CDA1 family)